MYPAKLAGVPDALIFFWFLFFHQGKKRKSRFKSNALCVVLVEEVHARYLLSFIDQHLAVFDILPQVSVTHGLLLHEVDLLAEKILQRILEIEEVEEGILDRLLVKSHDQIHIAFVVEAIGEHRAKSKQPLDAVSAAEVGYLCVVLAEEIHAGELQTLLVLMYNLIFFIAQS